MHVTNVAFRRTSACRTIVSWTMAATAIALMAAPLSAQSGRSLRMVEIRPTKPAVKPESSEATTTDSAATRKSNGVAQAAWTESGDVEKSSRVERAGMTEKAGGASSTASPPSPVIRSTPKTPATPRTSERAAPATRFSERNRPDEAARKAGAVRKMPGVEQAAGPGQSPSSLAAGKAASAKGDKSTIPNATPRLNEKTVSLNHFNAGWDTVLKDLAQDSGSTLVMDQFPDGRFTRRDRQKHNRADAVKILNRDLEPEGYRLLEKGDFLTLVEMRQARTEYRRPTYPAERGAKPESAVAADDSRVLLPLRSTGQAGRDRVSPANFQLEGVNGGEVTSAELKQSSPQRSSKPEVATSTRAFPLEHQTATPLARRIRSAFRERSRLVDAGPSGLPAFEVLVSHTGAPKVWFQMEIDADRNQLIATGAPSVLEGIGTLVRQLDQHAMEATPTRLLSGGDSIVEIGQRMRPAIGRIAAAQTPGQNGRDAARQPIRPNDRVPPVIPDGQGDPAAELPGMLGNLKSDVTIEAVDELDLLILRGNEADIDAVQQVIQAIERLAVGSAPEIRLHLLAHVDSNALADVLSDVYEKLGQLKTRTSGNTNQRLVNVVAVGRPNAVLILAPGAMVDSVVALIEELDQPADPRAEVQVFRLKYAVASEVVTMIDSFYADRKGLETRLKAVADSRTNAIVVQARPAELAEITSLIKRIDRDEAKAVSRLQIFPLQHATAETLAETLSDTITNILGASQTSSTGTGGGGGTTRAAKSLVLEFLGRGASSDQVLRSGLLADVRIKPDVRTNSLLISASEQTLPLLAELIDLLDQPATAVSDIKVFTLKKADATAIGELLQQLFTESQSEDAPGLQLAGAENGPGSLAPLKFSVDVRTNSIVAMGGADSLRIVEAILIRLDEDDSRNRRNVVIKLRNAPAADVAAAINQFQQGQRDLAQIDPNRITTNELLEQEIIVTAEPVTNSLLISATPRYFDEVMRITADLDREPAQVIIQALLVEVTLTNTDEFGVELGFQDGVLFNRSTALANSLQSYTTLPPGSTTTVTTTGSVTGVPGYQFNNQPLGNNIAPGINSSRVGPQGLSSFSLGRTNDTLGFGGMVLSASSESVSVLIRALAARRDVRVLSRPQILALDNQTATIQVGQRVPIVNGITQNQLGTANPQIIQDPAGIILTVAPRISPEGQVVMEIAAEKSQFPGTTVPIFQNGTQTINSPIKDITQARTTVKVADGQTIVVGGMITKQDDTIERKVPWLGDIPLVGKLFRYDAYNYRRTELLIFLTPRVVDGPDEAEFIKQVEAERLHYFECEAEEIHGPLFGVPMENYPYLMDQGIPLNGPLEIPGSPAGPLPTDLDGVPTTIMPRETAIPPRP